MRLATLAIGLLATFVSNVTATALTYKLEANEKACFHSNVDHTNSKVAFYFAVRLPYFPFLFLFVLRGEHQLIIFVFRSNPAVPSMSITR